MAEENGQNKKKSTGYSRRDFLKIVGASTGVAAAGCGDQLPEKLIPYVVQPDDVVPGVAAWYAGACSECSAGCGTLVRTREGRAVKIEGNPEHPINRGGLCSKGQSALQTLYSPDRVREPLSRENGAAFSATSWKQNVKSVADALKALPDGKEAVLLTGNLSGSVLALIDEISKSFPRLRHVSYELFNDTVLNAAVEECYGAGSRVRYDFSKANMVLSFGADYLETWRSPVEYARDWASRRKSNGRPVSYCVHIEPRLSLTAANADRWIKNTPGSEAAILYHLLRAVLHHSRLKNSSGDFGGFASRGPVEQFLAQAKVSYPIEDTGLDKNQIEGLADRLVRASNSLVLAGGVASSGERAEDTAVLAVLLNALLGNVGQTVIVDRQSSTRNVRTASIEELIISMRNDKVGLLITSGVNPVYSLSQKSGFKQALAKVPHLVSITTEIDETASLANIVFPKSTSFESWTDSEPRAGVLNLSQPAMQPLYQTQSLADTLLSIASAAGVSFGKVSSFYEYIKAHWEKRTGQASFNSRWDNYIESGGDWSAYKASGEAVALNITASAPMISKASEKSLKVMAFPSVHFFDGSAANRPWSQEVPDPLSTAVWGSWIEIHPDLAKQKGIEQGAVVRLAAAGATLEAPVYLRDEIHPDLVAIPIGQGHEQFGRYASGVGVNPLQLLPAVAAGGAQSFLTDVAEISKTISKEKLINTQMHDSQENRGLIRLLDVADDSKKAPVGHDAAHKQSDQNKEHHGKNGHGKDSGHGESGGHSGHHRDPKALGPQPPDRQMYHQMEHVQHHWGMSVDLASCTGCAACVVACYAENNIAVVGKEYCEEGREMSWLRIERYKGDSKEQPIEGFLPMMCQHCGNAPCEPVCPVYATYHNDEGLNVMVYNRCVGTRYCSNNCSYKVRRYNWFKYDWPEPSNWQLNPDVTVREVGIMEKCSFCVQRIREGKDNAKSEGRAVRDGEIQPACASSCPTSAITFGNLNDHDSEVYKQSQSERSYKILDVELNTQPGVNYLARITNKSGEVS